MKPPKSSSLLVLVVEDAPAVRDMAHQAIDELGYAVISVGSAEAALAAMDGVPCVDVLIADISLPGKSGLDLAALSMEKHPSVKVIFASGYGEVSEHLGVKSWSLPKPYDTLQLQALLETVAGRPQTIPTTS